MRRRGSNSLPLAAAALPLLLLLLLVADCFHCVAAVARHLPSLGAPVQALDHQAENGVKAASAGADGAGGLMLPEAGTGNGDELSSTLLEMTTTMRAEACDEGNDKDECLLRRLLLDVHLDYIYTLHKGKP